MFYEGLASMLGAGIPIRTALHQAASGAGGAFGEVLRHLQRETERGRPLSDAMAERPGAFPRHQVEMVRAAETGGTLDRTLRALAATEAAEEREWGRLTARLAYPLAVLHFAAVPLNIHLLVEGRFPRFLGGCLLFWIPLWAVLAGILLLYRRARTGGTASRVVLGIPLVGGLVRDRAQLRWARVFAALEDAGIAADRCTERAAAATGLAALQGPLAAPAGRIRQGVSRADAFAPAPLPPDLYQALAQGEMTGTIAEALGKAADAREQAAESRAETLVNLAPVLATILVGAVVLLVALRFYWNLYRIPK